MVTSDGTKVFFASDQPVSEPNGCELAIYRWYGSFIESYVTTVFHHGNYGGADNRVYYVIKPKIVLWCVDQYRLDLNGLKSFPHNFFFASNNAPRLGVLGVYIAGDNVQILSFDDGAAIVEEYDTFAKYLAS